MTNGNRDTTTWIALSLFCLAPLMASAEPPAAPTRALEKTAAPKPVSPSRSAFGKVLRTQKASLIGWSKDESAVAYRFFAVLGEEDLAMDQGEPTFCKGYVDHENKRFVGSLEIIVISGHGANRQIFPVQDFPRCTPFGEAKKRLEASKAALVAAGIDPKAKDTGRELAVKDKQARWSDACGTLRLAVKTERKEPEDPDAEEVDIEGFARLVADQGDKTSPLGSIPLRAKQSLIMSDFKSWDMPSVFLSPSGERAIAFLREKHGSMRGSSDRVEPMWFLRCAAGVVSSVER